MKARLAKGVDPSLPLFLPDFEKKTSTNTHPPAELTEYKAHLRQAVLTKRNAFALQAEAKDASYAAQQNLITTNAWQQAESVGLYMPIRSEIDTRMLLDDALHRGLSVFLPRCCSGQTGKMVFAQCRSMDDLVPGVFGILEPDLSRCPVVTTVPDLLVIPAVAIDRRGVRLGYGGGYYDRMLSLPAWESCLKLGFVYALQLVDELPREAWDISLQGIITEEEMLWL